MQTTTTEDQAFAILDDLVAFVHRVALDKQASQAEVSVLPEIVKILLECAPIHG